VQPAGDTFSRRLCCGSAAAEPFAPGGGHQVGVEIGVFCEALLLQHPSRIFGKVREDHVRTGPLNAGERFQHDPFLI
jgi:hypothetical protein